jgi:tRNA1(Val) A37 N6-methylase TrmN6
LRTGVGVEIQQELHEFALRNFEENGLAGRLAAVRGDFRERLPGVSPRAFDLVVSNPPFRRVGEGRRNPDAQKEIARHEVTCTLTDLFRAAGRHLSPKGRFALVGLTQRLPEIFSCAEAERIFPETLRFIHPYPGRPASRVLFAGGRRKTPGFSVLPPLVIYSGEGRYHPEVERIYSGMLKMQEGKPRQNK